jgi:L-alanine-DL-glutamate epimerase-like enolase superfamily enzyme
MRVERLLVRTDVLRREDTDWRTATYASADVFAVHVGLEVDGVIGVGATAVKSRVDSPQDLIDRLTNLVRPIVEGTELGNVRIALERSPASNHPRVLLAFDLALYDLVGKLAKVPAEFFWGGVHRDSVTVVRMIGLKEPEEAVAAADPLVRDGYLALKIKGGDGVSRDVARVRALREAYDPSLILMLDANGAYTTEEAISLARGLERYQLTYLEQPVPYDDLESLAAVTRGSPIDIVADQYVTDTESATEVCRRGAAAAVSIKLTKMGTISECLRVMAVCEAFGVAAHLGGSAAPALVDAAACRFALSQPSLGHFAEVGESMGLSGDPGTPVVITNGESRTSGGYGLDGPSRMFAT